MVRHYGNPPWKVAVVHGGPGAPGTVTCIARELGKTTGTLEPIQSRESVDELILELDEQLDGFFSEPLVLIGHSWGAWLTLLYAARFPARTRHLVLVGAGPLTASSATEINIRRKQRLDPQQQAAFDSAITALQNSAAPPQTQDIALSHLANLTQLSDNYQLIPPQNTCSQDQLPFNARQYAKVWPEAELLRNSGALLKRAKDVRCPITVLHGAEDPHPAAGIIAPFTERGIQHEAHIFPHCGHAPFLEVHAADDFFRKIARIVAKSTHFSSKQKSSS